MPALLRLPVPVVGSLRAAFSPGAPLPRRTAILVLPLPVPPVVVPITIPVSVSPVAISVHPSLVVSQEVASEVLSHRSLAFPFEPPRVPLVLSVLPRPFRGGLDGVRRKTALQHSWLLLLKMLPGQWLTVDPIKKCLLDSTFGYLRWNEVQNIQNVT